MTQTAKHTPAPWNLVKCAKGWFIRTKDGCTIGGINRFPGTAEMASQCEPNAQLVVAAPELLQALQSILEIESLRNNPCNVGNAGALNELLRDIAGMARTAVSKATAA